jgi:acyl carrier protein
MSSLSKYKEIFQDSLSIKPESFDENIKYNEIPEWDSIGHMTLVSNLESEFDISIEVDDILDFSSYKKGVELLKKYKVEIS